MNSPTIDLSVITSRLANVVDSVHSREPQPTLICARFADRCRDAGLMPLDDAALAATVESLDEAGWRRMALQVALFDEAPIRSVLHELVSGRGLIALFRDGLVWTAIDKTLLTTEVLRQSELRIEEFARHFAAAMRIAIVGETRVESAQKRHRLDYSRLTSEVEHASKTVEQHLEEKRQLALEQTRRDKLLRWFSQMPTS